MMEYADFKSWLGICCWWVLTRHGIPFNLLVFVLVSMATLPLPTNPPTPPCKLSDFYVRQVCGWMYALAFFCPPRIVNWCICTLVTALAVRGVISTMKAASIWITSPVYWIDYWMDMTTGCDLALEVRQFYAHFTRNCLVILSRGSAWQKVKFCSASCVWTVSALRRLHVL